MVTLIAIIVGLLIGAFVSAYFGINPTPSLLMIGLVLIAYGLGLF